MRFNNTFLKKLIYTVGTAVFASAAVSCDNIAEDDRYIIVNPVVPERVVLIEDFTGQKCVNCPDAHAVIESLQEQYPEAVLAVSIHGGAFAYSTSQTRFNRNFIGLGTPEGEYYNAQFGINSWPKGIINRNGQIYNYDEWATVVRKELERPSDLAINLEAKINTDGETDKIDINIKLLPQADIDGYLQVWVLESGIVATQQFKDGVTKNDYVHNNVLRAAVNGYDGEEIALTKGTHSTASYSIEMRDNDHEYWNPENLSIVAFVRNASGVHQAVKVDVQKD